MSPDPTAAGRIPTLHVVGASIPQAHYRAMKAVWEQGLAIRTEYDRKDSAGNYIDPPSRDARVLIEVTDPFSEPRYPPVSFCEIGNLHERRPGEKSLAALEEPRTHAAGKGTVIPRRWSRWRWIFTVTSKCVMINVQDRRHAPGTQRGPAPGVSWKRVETVLDSARVFAPRCPVQYA